MAFNAQDRKEIRDMLEKRVYPPTFMKNYLLEALDTLDILEDKASALTNELTELVLDEWADQGIGVTNSNVIKRKRDALVFALSGSKASSLRRAALSLILYRERNDPLQLEKLDDYIRQLKEAL